MPLNGFYGYDTKSPDVYSRNTTLIPITSLSLYQAMISGANQNGNNANSFPPLVAALHYGW